ncbi:MAG: sulfurtransferase [Chloroflexi bacterium]|nr:sulfurtransferase [Chloroflexota bacterium]
MIFTTIIDVNTAHQHVNDADWLIIDCRFNLAEPDQGFPAYQQAHVPTAVYAHLDNDLSGPPVTDTGRHPLPTPATLTALFSKWGIAPQTQVVVYDQENGMLASRLWWMLRYMGHTAVSVLEGGWPAWQAAGLPTQSGVEVRQPTRFSGAANTDWLVQLADVPDIQLLIDSRDGARYRGEHEPIDKQAGHIPGAINYFYQDNWTADGRYLSPAQISAKLTLILGDTPPEQATFYCGSGVTACANLLAMAHAGLGNGRLYVGSWSEWSSDPGRPIAVGE